jgi:hypothetical protein
MSASRPYVDRAAVISTRWQRFLAPTGIPPRNVASRRGGPAPRRHHDHWTRRRVVGVSRNSPIAGAAALPFGRWVRVVNQSGRLSVLRPPQPRWVRTARRSSPGASSSAQARPASIHEPDRHPRASRPRPSKRCETFPPSSPRPVRPWPTWSRRRSSTPTSRTSRNSMRYMRGSCPIRHQRGRHQRMSDCHVASWSRSRPSHCSPPERAGAGAASAVARH